MRKFLLIITVVIVILAGGITVQAGLTSNSQLKTIAAIILTLAAAIQRVNVVYRWFSRPDSQAEDIADFAQQTLLSLCKGRRITENMLYLSIHIWEVPRWYRRLFPYTMRKALKRFVKRGPFRLMTKFSLAPTLHRAAAIRLIQLPPSGVELAKGKGIVGECIANNDANILVRFDASEAAYQQALNVSSEHDWRKYAPEITHNLTLDDARTLSRAYQQVLATVVKDRKSGEPIGCITISARNAPTEPPAILENDRCERLLSALALLVRGPLSIANK